MTLRGLAGAAAITLLPHPLVGQTALSIYSDGRVVVRHTLAQPLDKGRNSLTVKLEGVDPATLFSPDTSVALVSGVWRPASDRAAALARAIGQTLSFVRPRAGGGADTVRATVIRVNPSQYRLPDGRLLLGDPGEPLFPPELMRSGAELSVALEAARARPRTELAYVMSGAARWEAVYQVLLFGAKCAVSGTATITSQTLRADSAEVQLVAGSISRARGGPPGPLQPFRAQALAAAVVSGESASEEAVGETHVYQVPGRSTLEPGVPLTVALFPQTSAPYTQEFVVPGAVPLRGFFGQMPTEPNRVPVQVWYTLARARGTSFGDRPLPGGTVQLYQGDSAGRLQLVGEALTEHTAPGRELRLQSGEAFDVTAERVETDYTQEQLAAPRRGLAPRQRVTATFRVTITNAKPDAVTVDVREARIGTWRVTDSSLPAERLSASEVRFRVPVPAKGDAALTYTIQVES
ncbi:MAG TPA: hypothetical protein VM736_12430 [Gemmatimonadales bacterium]|nr:hypothetical protein [Gemmatimonadales bacterium]